MSRPVPWKLIAWDLETRGLGGDPIYMSVCDERGARGYEVTGDDVTHAFLRHVLGPSAPRGFVIAHYGTRFDLLRLDWPAMAAAGFKARFYVAKNQNDILGIDLSYKKWSWRIRDSWRYAPMSLRDLAATFGGVEKLELDLEHVDFDVRDRAHVAYALRDAEALYQAFRGYVRAVGDAFGVTPIDSVTASGVAYRALRHHARTSGYRDMEPIPERLEAVARESYHGGLCAAFRVGEFRDVTVLDVNSMYGDVMLRCPLPSGRPVVTEGPVDDLDALQLVELDIPDDVFPLLLTRSATRGLGRYSGRCLTWAWGFEVAAQVGLGARLVGVRASIRWPDRDDRHRGFVERCRELRLRDYHGPVGLVAKLLQNSVYGKHGSTPRERDVVLAVEPPPQAIPVYDRMDQIVPYLWSVPARHRGGTMVHWASYITARARVRLVELLSRLPRDAWLYCDTDSVFVATAELGRYRDLIGPDYGELKVEGEFETLRIRAPKTYSGRLADGRRKTKAKGIPRRYAEDAFERGVSAAFETGRSLGVVMRDREGGYVRMVSRRLSGPDSVLSGYYDGGIWRPYTIDDPVATEITS